MWEKILIADNILDLSQEKNILSLISGNNMT